MSRERVNLWLSDPMEHERLQDRLWDTIEQSEQPIPGEPLQVRTAKEPPVSYADYTRHRPDEPGETERDGLVRDLISAAKCAESILILLEPEIERLGCNASNVLPNLSSAIEALTK
jgi:hypothetical protein